MISAILSSGVYIFLFIALYFEVFLLLTYLEKRPKMRTGRRELPYYPRTAVIVPCFNEASTIGRTLESLLALDYPKERLFIAVVDDGSTDNTFEIAKGYERHENVRVYRKENGGKHTALNFAIEKLDTELIGCLDADSFVAPQALREIAYYFVNGKELMAVTPAIKVENPRNFLELMQRAEYTLGIFYKRMFGTMAAIPVLPGPFSIYRREVFERIGGFRKAHNTEDMEMTLRMHAHRMPIENAHTAHVYTTVPRTLGTLIKQRTRWVQGFLQNSRDYKYMYFNPRFGALGMFVLPAGILSIYSGLYLVGYTIYSLIGHLISSYTSLSAIGFSFGVPQLSLFFLDTSATFFLIVILLFFTLFLMALGRRIAEDNIFSWDILWYLSIYGFVVPIWVAKAVFNTALARTTTWR